MFDRAGKRGHLHFVKMTETSLQESASPMCATMNIHMLFTYPAVNFSVVGAPFVAGVPYGPRRKKSCLRGFQQSDTQTSLLSYRD